MAPRAPCSPLCRHPGEGRGPASAAARWKHVAVRAIHPGMTKLEKIEQDIASLSPGEMAKLARWFAEFQADVWDRQIEADAGSGRLDTLAEQALAAHKAGKTRPL